MMVLDSLSIEPKRGEVQICAVQTDRSASLLIDYYSGQRGVLRLRRDSRAGANPDARSGHHASFHHDHSIKRPG